MTANCHGAAFSGRDGAGGERRGRRCLDARRRGAAPPVTLPSTVTPRASDKMLGFGALAVRIAATWLEPTLEELRTDYLVLGSGIAGLRAAIGLARHGQVLVVTKDQPTESNTGYAQGGVAVALGRRRRRRACTSRTPCAPGAGIVSRPRRACWWRRGRSGSASWPPGARASTARTGALHFTREGAHSRSRVLHALGDATGWEMVRTLLEKAQRTPEHRGALLRLLHRPRASATAAWSAAASSTATAGAETLVLGARHAAGHGRRGPGLRARPPTRRWPPATAWPWPCARGPRCSTWSSSSSTPPRWPCPGAPRFLVSEAVRGEGARLVNGGGRALHGRAARRATRWRARSPARTRAGRGPVRLDLRHLDAERVRTRFPRIHATCLRYGVDITREPGAGDARRPLRDGRRGHATSTAARTLPGLYAAGEAAGTGVHGANRLASNSLLGGPGVRRARRARRWPGTSTRSPPARRPSPIAAVPARPRRSPPRLARRAARARLGGAGPGARRRRACARCCGWLDGAARRLPALLHAGARRPRRATWPTSPGPWPRSRRCSARRAGAATSARDFPQPDDARFHGHTLLDEGGAAPGATLEARRRLPARAGAPA